MMMMMMKPMRNFYSKYSFHAQKKNQAKFNLMLQTKQYETALLDLITEQKQDLIFVVIERSQNHEITI